MYIVSHVWKLARKTKKKKEKTQATDSENEREQLIINYYNNNNNNNNKIDRVRDRSNRRHAPWRKRPTLEEGGAARKYYVAEQSATQIHVCLCDRIHEDLMYTLTFLANDIGCE